ESGADRDGARRPGRGHVQEPQAQHGRLVEVGVDADLHIDVLRAVGVGHRHEGVLDLAVHPASVGAASDHAGQDGVMRWPSTSTYRTYRYVRLAIVGAVVLLAVSLNTVFVDDGPITSISALVYTPGRSIFVGVLFAITLALVALSGHSLEQVLLDLAALF